jgi:hypothetical protein
LFRRQCNCRRNWRFITATRKDPKLLSPFCARIS